MPRKKETRPSLQAKGRVSNEAATDNTTFLCDALTVAYRGGIAMCALMFVALVALSWGLTA